MMPHSDHVIYANIGNEIVTRPGERFVNSIHDAIRMGAHGCFSGGVGRIGKTSQIYFLTRTGETWLPTIGGGILHSFVVPPGPRSPSASRLMLTNAFNISTVSKEPVVQVANLITARCAHARTRRMVIFLDNAQNLRNNDYNVLVYLDHLLIEKNVLPFMVFVQQSDSDGGASQLSLQSYASDITGRWCISDYHIMTGLDGINEVEHALKNYGRFRSTPGDPTYQETFAPSAVTEGWELFHDTELIADVVGDVRRKNNLNENGDWPMKTFVATARYLLVEVASRNPAFLGFKEDDVRNALRASGYLALERVHSGHDVPPPHGGNP